MGMREYVHIYTKDGNSVFPFHHVDPRISRYLLIHTLVFFSFIQDRVSM